MESQGRPPKEVVLKIRFEAQGELDPTEAAGAAGEIWVRFSEMVRCFVASGLLLGSSRQDRASVGVPTRSAQDRGTWEIVLRCLCHSDTQSQ